MNLVKELEKVYLEKDMRYSELASILNIKSSGLISLWFRGHFKPNARNMYKIKEFLKSQGVDCE